MCASLANTAEMASNKKASQALIRLASKLVFMGLSITAITLSILKKHLKVVMSINKVSTSSEHYSSFTNIFK